MYFIFLCSVPFSLLRNIILSWLFISQPTFYSVLRLLLDFLGRLGYQHINLHHASNLNIASPTSEQLGASVCYNRPEMATETMSLMLTDPRGLPRDRRSNSYISRLLNSAPLRERERDCQSRYSSSRQLHTESGRQTKQPRPCFDWIFSTASNVHVAIDRAAFTSYTPFDSYVLTVSDQSLMSVLGIGSVDLDLRRKAGSRKCHTITLDNVLHVPNSRCNLFSDLYFHHGNGQYEHSWEREGVQFMKKIENNDLRAWGYTEEFCGLDRLVLARNLKGRSPMMDESDREVFSVSVTWPLGQRDRWEVVLKHFDEQKREREELEADKLDKLEKTSGLGRRSSSMLNLKAQVSAIGKRVH